MPLSTRWPLSFRLPLASRRWQIVFSSGVLLGLLGLLWVEISSRENLEMLWPVFVRQIFAANWVWLVLAFMLMPFNWLAETWKWHRMIRRWTPVSLWRSLIAVWVGVSFSLFTPNRVGEYGGRILLIQPRHRWKAAIANLIGNYSQLLVLLTAGIGGGLYYAARFWYTDPHWQGVFAGAALLLLSVLYLFYFNLGWLVTLLHRIPWLNNRQFLVREARVLQLFNTAELTGLLGWALVRYGIYSTQYYLLLCFFGITPGLSAGYAGISAIFLLQTSLPLPPLTALVARGNLAVQIWLPFGANALSSLAATFTLWILNLILPALIGTFSLFYVNITKSPGHEDD